MCERSHLDETRGPRDAFRWPKTHASGSRCGAHSINAVLVCPRIRVDILWRTAVAPTPGARGRPRSSWGAEGQQCQKSPPPLLLAQRFEKRARFFGCIWVRRRKGEGSTRALLVVTQQLQSQWRHQVKAILNFVFTRKRKHCKMWLFSFLILFAKSFEMRDSSLFCPGLRLF